MTPGGGIRHGEEGLDQAVHAGRARGGKGPGRGRAGKDGVGAELVSQGPRQMDLAIGLHVKGNTKRPELQLGLLGIEPGHPGREAEFHLPARALSRADADRSLAARTSSPLAFRHPLPCPGRSPHWAFSMATRALPLR